MVCKEFLFWVCVPKLNKMMCKIHTEHFLNSHVFGTVKKLRVCIFLTFQNVILVSFLQHAILNVSL